MDDILDLNGIVDTLLGMAAEYHEYVVIALAIAVFVTLFFLGNIIGEWFQILLYKTNVRKAQRIASGKDDDVSNLIPIFPKKFTIGINIVYLLVGGGLGMFAAVMAQDWLLSPVFLISFFGMGYGFFRGQQGSSYIMRRGQLADVLRILGNNLETYQSVQIAVEELYKHYTTNVEKKERDPEFEENLKTLTELMVQEGNIDIIADRIFGGDEVYQVLAKSISVATRSGIANAVKHCRETTDKLIEWRSLVSMMNTEVGGIRASAMVLEFLLIGAVIVTLFPMLGDIDNMIHSYFFANTGNKLFLTAILFAHTIVQIGMMEFIKINGESL